MANEVAINIHTRPGDEVLVEEDSHVNNYELSSMAAYSGVLARPISTELGWFTREQVEAVLRPNAYFISRPGLVVLENTHNMKGGTIYPQEHSQAVTQFAREKSLPVHLDGARIANASATTGQTLKDLMGRFDSAMFTFSKGLGCPAGSILVGSKPFIEEARVVRKRMGGGMRQVGILAAACLYALEHNVSQLKADHEKAQQLANLLSEYGHVNVTRPETNILVFELTQMLAADFAEKLLEAGIKSIPIGTNKMRLVTHLDITDEAIAQTEDAIKKILD